MTLEIFAKAFFELCTPSVLLFLCLGVVIGTVIGALPGLSATMGIAIMTPITFWFPPANGFALLMGLWNAAIFSGGISAILINTPGTPASISQSLDGYQMYRQGKGGLALGVNVIYSFMGGIFSTLCLILFSTPIANFTVTFNAPEYCMLALFGLSMMIAVSTGNVLKGTILGVAGILLSCVGLDPLLAVPRFTFGSVDLLAGISFIPVMIGMFGIGEVLYQMYSRNRAEEAAEMKARKVNLALGRVLPSFKEFKELTIPTLIGAVEGTLIGAIPAAGGDIGAVPVTGCGFTGCGTTCELDIGAIGCTPCPICPLRISRAVCPAHAFLFSICSCSCGYSLYIMGAIPRFTASLRSASPMPAPTFERSTPALLPRPRRNSAFPCAFACISRNFFTSGEFSA